MRILPAVVQGPPLGEPARPPSPHGPCIHLAEPRSSQRDVMQPHQILECTVAGNVKCESVGLMRKLLNGKYWPAVPHVSMGLVDVDDVASAHTLAMCTPAAEGRQAEGN